MQTLEIFTKYRNVGLPPLVKLCSRDKPHKHRGQECSNMGKAPIESHWQKTADTIFTSERLFELVKYEENFGLPIPSALVVLDADSYEDATRLWMWLDQAKLKYWQQHTSKGAHFILRQPIPGTIRNTVKATVGAVTFDVRGCGGQIAVCPSIHKTGKAYTWRIAPWDLPINQLSELPMSIANQLTAPKETTKTTELAIPSGGRNDSLFRLGSSLRAKGMGEQEIAAALRTHNQAYCQPPLSSDEINIIIGQVVRYEQGQFASKPAGEITLNRDSYGKLSRFLSLANQYKRYGKSPKDVLEALQKQKSGTISDEDLYKHVIETVFSDHALDVELHNPEKSLDEYRNRMTKRGQFGEPELPTGFKNVDSMTWGLKRGHVFTLGGDTGIGKTSFIATVTAQLLNKGKRVLFMSTEMGFDNIFNRIIAVNTGLKVFTLESGQLDAAEKVKWEAGVQTLRTQGLVVCDMSEPTPASVRKAVENSQPDVVMFDHIQHIHMETDHRHVEVSKFMKGLKSVAKDFHIAVIVASQITPPPSGMMPTKHSLKESHDIENESSVILLLHTDKTPPPDVEVIPVMGILDKNRDGACGILTFAFNRPLTKYGEG